MGGVSPVVACQVGAEAGLRTGPSALPAIPASPFTRGQGSGPAVSWGSHGAGMAAGRAPLTHPLHLSNIIKATSHDDHEGSGVAKLQKNFSSNNILVRNNTGSLLRRKEVTEEEAER